MIIALLILIVLILLFGAGVVKGWLLNVAGAILGFILLAVVIVTVTHYFGEDAFMWMLVIGGSLLLGLSLWARGGKWN